jgi:tetratricopeptide (TPR) repeat protein
VTRTAQIALAAALASTPSAAQTDALARRAHDAYLAERWEEAASAYAQVADLTGEGAAWFRLGHARLELGRIDTALEALEAALRLGFSPPHTHYMLARAYARAGRNDHALDQLGQAVAGGLQDAGAIREQAEFEPLRSSPLFQAALDRAADPVAYMEGGTALDFWLGEWDVLAGDELVGTNRIEKILGGAAILEHWTGSGGARGESLFYFLPDSAQWKQVWVVQGALLVKEKLSTHVEGGLRFEGEARFADGRRLPDRTTLTLQDDGSVRQLIEVSRDGGKTWTPTFDARYVRR